MEKITGRISAVFLNEKQQVLTISIKDIFKTHGREFSVTCIRDESPFFVENPKYVYPRKNFIFLTNSRFFDILYV